MADSPEIPGAEPPNPELNALLTHLQHMNADEVIKEFNKVKPEVEEIKEELKKKENVDAISFNKKLPNEMRKIKQTELKKIVDVVKQTVIAIRFPEESAIEPINNSKVLKNIIDQVVGYNGISQINENNAIFIYKLIEQDLAGNLGTVENLIKTFESISLLEEVDKILYIRISKSFLNEAVDMGEKDGNKLNKLRTKDDLKAKTSEIVDKNRVEILLKENRKVLETAQSTIDSLTLDLTGTDVEELVNDEIKENTEEIGSESALFAKKAKMEANRDLIKSDLTFGLMRIYSPRRSQIPKGLSNKEFKEYLFRETLDSPPITPQEIQENYKNFQALVDNHKKLGHITNAEHMRLTRKGKDVYKITTELLGLQGMVGETGIWESAQYYVRSGWSGKNTEILQNMGDAKTFKKFIMDRYNEFRNQEDWRNFQRDITGLFDQLFSSVKSNPKDFWEKTFNELTEGMFYKNLLTTLRQLGSDLGKDSVVKSTKVWLEESLFEPAEDTVPNIAGIGGLKMARDKLLPKSLDEAIGSVLVSEMIDHKEVTETLHNMAVIADLGLGFDKIDEYSSRVRMEEIAKMVKSTPGLSDAHQLYHDYTELILASHGHNFPANFGQKVAAHYNLDEAGWRTFLQLKHSDKIKKLGLKNEEIANLVQTATGLSKGIFFGFWSMAWNNRIGFEFVIDNARSDREKGKIYYKRKTTYRSLMDKGVEKMLPSIDFVLQIEHFDMLRRYPALIHTWSPRDLNAKMTLEDFLFRHEDVEMWHKENEDAQANGFSNQLGDFDTNHIFLADSMRTESIDVAERGGWRNVDYQRYLIYKTNENGELLTDPNSDKKIIDFDLTMKRLHGPGEAYMIALIDDIFLGDKGEANFQKDVSDLDIKNLGKDIIERYKGELKKVGKKGWRVGDDLNEEQKTELKALFYEKYVFEPRKQQFPSRYINMENRRWMPRDEAAGGKNLHDTLVRFLLKKFGKSGLPEGFTENNYLPLFIEAVKLMEREQWNKNMEVWIKNEEVGNYKGKDPLDYTFHLTKQDITDNKEKLKELYIDFKEGQGLEKRDGKELEISDDLFYNNLQEFYEEMIKCIEQERWTRSIENGRQAGERTTLPKRYAWYLAHKMANVSTYVSWTSTNLDITHFHTSGSRVSERIAQECGVLQKELVPALQDIFFVKLPALISRKYENDHEFEKAVHELFSQSLAKASASVQNIDADQAYVFLGRWVYALGIATGKDRLKRVGTLGTLFEEFSKRGWGKQSSYMTDNIPDTLREAASSLTSTQIEIMTTVLCEAIGMRRERHFPNGYENPTLFGKEVHGILAKFLPRKQKHGESSISTEALIEAQGVQLPIRLLESTPTFGLVFLIIMAMLAKLAFDKDNKK